MWSALGFTNSIANVNIDSEHIVNAKWILNSDIINKFRQRIGDDERYIIRLNEALNLIPIVNPFVTM